MIASEEVSSFLSFKTLWRALFAIRPRFSLRRKGRIPVHSIGSNGGRRLAWSRGFTPPRGYQSPVMDGDPGALVTPRRSGPEVVGSNPTGPAKPQAETAAFGIKGSPSQSSSTCTAGSGPLLVVKPHLELL